MFKTPSSQKSEGREKNSVVKAPVSSFTPSGFEEQKEQAKHSSREGKRESEKRERERGEGSTVGSESREKQNRSW